jgi:hypothetical protein
MFTHYTFERYIQICYTLWEYKRSQGMEVAKIQLFCEKVNENNELGTAFFVHKRIIINSYEGLCY